jgi:hypothetical protein
MTKDQKQILRERIRDLQNTLRWREEDVVRSLKNIEKFKEEIELLQALVQDPKDATA